jgi:hypothetical protein
MPQYQQKIDSQEFKVANPDQSSRPWSGDARADATDLVIRLWSPQRSAPPTWKTDSVLVYMVADLVGASHGRIAEDSPAIMGAHFDSSRHALVAAKRIQTSILEFLTCRPGERVGAAILLYRPTASDPTEFSPEIVQQALRQVKPGQILLAKNISQQLRDLPGVEFRNIPAVTTIMGERQPELSELVWTTPERVALLQVSVSDEVEPQSPDLPTIGATVIVHSPLARQESIREGAPPAAGSGKVVAKNGFETVSQEAGQAANNPQDRGPAFAEGDDEFGERPFITRSRVILGLVAVVLVTALIAVLYRPAHVSKLPLPVQLDQSSAREIPGRQPPATTEPEAKTPEPESKIVKTEIAKPQKINKSLVKSPAKVTVGAQPQMSDNVSVDNRSKSQKDTPEAQAYYSDESGGVSLKDIPVLLRMAQQDAGAGNYNKARTEYRKILGLQPGNQDARDGLHKLDIIQKDQQ